MGISKLRVKADRDLQLLIVLQLPIEHRLLIEHQLQIGRQLLIEHQPSLQQLKGQHHQVHLIGQHHQVHIIDLLLGPEQWGHVLLLVQVVQVELVQVAEVEDDKFMME